MQEIWTTFTKIIKIQEFKFITFLQSACNHDSQKVFIQDRNSGLVWSSYKPDGTYEIVIAQQLTSASSQRWILADSVLLDICSYIQSVVDNNIITAGDAKRQDPLIVAPKRDGLDLNQMWIQCEPGSETNAHFVSMSAKTGNVMDVKGADKSPGTRVQIFFVATVPTSNLQFIGE